MITAIGIIYIQEVGTVIGDILLDHSVALILGLNSWLKIEIEMEKVIQVYTDWIRIGLIYVSRVSNVIVLGHI